MTDTEFSDALARLVIASEGCTVLELIHRACQAAWMLTTLSEKAFEAMGREEALQLGMLMQTIASIGGAAEIWVVDLGKRVEAMTKAERKVN